MFTLFYFVPRVPLLKTMAEKGWCQLVPSLLHTTENDTREKVLQALHVMVEGCKSEFQQPRVHDSLNKLKLEWLKDANRKEGHEDPEYVTILAQLVTDLISKLTWWIWLVKLGLEIRTNYMCVASDNHEVDSSLDKICWTRGQAVLGEGQISSWLATMLKMLAMQFEWNW